MDVKGGTTVKGLDIAEVRVEVGVRVKVFDQCHEAEYVEAKDKAKQNPPPRHQCPCHE